MWTVCLLLSSGPSDPDCSLTLWRNQTLWTSSRPTWRTWRRWSRQRSSTPSTATCLCTAAAKALYGSATWGRRHSVTNTPKVRTPSASHSRTLSPIHQPFSNGMCSWTPLTPFSNRFCLYKWFLIWYLSIDEVPTSMHAQTLGQWLICAKSLSLHSSTLQMGNIEKRFKSFELNLKKKCKNIFRMR